MTVPTEYEHFRRDARTAVFHAHEEAARLGDNVVKTVHLLLALLKKDAETERILAGLGVQPADLVSDVERQVERSHGKLGEEMQLSTGVDMVFEKAVDEAHRIDSQLVTPGCLLAGIARLDAGLSGRVLKERGVTLAKIRSIIASSCLLTLMELNDAINKLPSGGRRRVCDPAGVCIAGLPAGVLQPIRSIVKIIAPAAELANNAYCVYIRPIPETDPAQYRISVPLSLTFDTVSQPPSE